VEVVPGENTATATALPPEQTSTATPVPEAAHWYWAVDPATDKVLAVNQSGERREIGALDQPDYSYTSSMALDHERALLFLDNDNTLRAYLLSPDGMQKIALPSEPFPFDTNLAQTSRAIIAVQADRVVFSYVTQGNSNVNPDTGPLYIMDLTSLTTQLIDKTVSRAPYSDNRSWIHASPDGRYLRYLNGSRGNMELRELDVVTGAARTLFTAGGSGFNIHGSPQGDLWYVRNGNIVLDLDGNQTSFTDASQSVRPLKDGKSAVFPVNCADDCEIKVVAPFGDNDELTYHLPWTIESGTFYDHVSQLLPDQSLLFAGKPYILLAAIPAAAETYAGLTQEDIPLFRLTPDGQARLVGVYAGQASADGQYILMKSSDQTSFFIYDALADRPLFDMPVSPDLEGFFPYVRFLDTGIVVNLEASVAGEENAYRNFYHAYFHQTSNVVDWEDVNLEYSSCPDLLEDGSIICWLYRFDTDNFDLVRYDPAAETNTTLLEDIWMIDAAQ